MRHGSSLTLVAAALAFAIGGCQRHEPASDVPAGGPPPTTAQTTPTDASVAGINNADAPPAATEPGQPSTGNGADLNVAESAEHGRYLVDATGKALYMLDKDSGGTSTCSDACSTEWPPLLAAQGTPRGMDEAVRADAIGTTKRTDGTVQVTYAGHPLYHYAKDLAAGQLNGHAEKDAFGAWHLVAPDGTAVTR